MTKYRHHALAAIVPPDRVHVELPKATGEHSCKVPFDLVERALVDGTLQRVFVLARLVSDPNPQPADFDLQFIQRDDLLDCLAAAAHLNTAYVYRLIKGEKSHPSSNAVIRLALALHLTVSETDEFLMSAGYAPLVIPGRSRPS